MPLLGSLDPRLGNARQKVLRQRVQKILDDQRRRSPLGSRPNGAANFGQAVGTPASAGGRASGALFSQVSRRGAGANFLPLNLGTGRAGFAAQAVPGFGVGRSGAPASQLPADLGGLLGGGVGGALPATEGPASSPFPGPPLTPSEQFWVDNPTQASAVQDSMLGATPGATLEQIIPGYVPPSGATSPAPGPVVPSQTGLIPLGGGLFIEASTGIVRGVPLPLGSAARR